MIKKILFSTLLLVPALSMADTSATAGENSPVLTPPPVKGVIHVRFEGENIDPEQDENPIRTKKLPPWWRSNTQIDPEREYPILGIGTTKVALEAIDPENERPLPGSLRPPFRNMAVNTNIDAPQTPIPGAVEVPKGAVLAVDAEKWTETPIPGAVEVPKFQASEDEASTMVYTEVDGEFELTPVPVSLVLAALDVVQNAELNIMMSQDEVLQIAMVTTAGAGLLMTIAYFGARANPVAAVAFGIFGATAAHAATLDDFYATPGGFEYFLSLDPAQQEREVFNYPILATRVMGMAQAIESADVQ